MQSTPVSAIWRTLARFTPPLASVWRRLGELHRHAQLHQVHVVEQMMSARRPLLVRPAPVCQLPLRSCVVVFLADALTAAAMDSAVVLQRREMIILDQHCVEQAGAMVVPAAAGHGVFSNSRSRRGLRVSRICARVP